MADIHATALVAEGATLGAGVRIGPYCIVGPHVSLGDGVELMAHVVIDGHTSIGANTRIYPFASLGQPPQHLKYAGEPTKLVIGEGNIIREHVTMNTGTAMGGGITTVGDRNFFMVNTHVAHDCHVGSQVVMANNAVLGGHVTVGDFAVFGGNCAVHQFVRIGRYAMISGVCGLAEDLIPYGFAFARYNNRASLGGLNLVGLKRRGVSREQVQTLRTAYRLLFAEEGTLKERLDDVADMYRDQEAVMEIVNFIRADAGRNICLPSTGRQGPA
ncbi:MAG: acyl-ACP--UDP-N-acetylglucosamine O-acyltransferase [Rhodospirillaceae bacterium]|nr:acyl-ACP--UDP-N-acetylglucosamine O-acyltransferase [Rhodospirillaceae bacterium]